MLYTITYENGMQLNLDYDSLDLAIIGMKSALRTVYGLRQEANSVVINDKTMVKIDGFGCVHVCSLKYNHLKDK